MKVKFVSEKENKLLGRSEMEIEIEHADATPSKAALQQYIAKEKKKDAECVEVLNILTGKGIKMSRSSVNLWNEKKVKDLSKKEEEKKTE
ncbi:MAG: hypothetical protein HYT73_02215 [Candidatus Aenigmarchaeota archaeon]|nr:hypothetical protein [Candidatus Aenigmarchaeota archaeon]